MKLLRILFTSATMLLGMITASAFFPVPAAHASIFGIFGGVHAHVSRSTGLWMITNSTNSQVTAKYRSTLRGSGIWANHTATIPANSDRLLGYDSKMYKLQVISHTP